MRYIFFSIVICFALPSFGQQYRNALGLRGGLGATATYKHFIGYTTALEVIGGRYDNERWGLAGIFEFHKILGTSRSFEWYWGLGPFLTFDEIKNNVGVTGAIGIHASLNDIPLNFSIDWLPRIRLNNNGKLILNGGGIGIRYIINR